MFESTGITRRRFLGQSAALGAAGSLAAVAAAQAPRAKVVVVTSPAVIDKDRPVNVGALRAMLDQGVAKLAGRNDAVSAWQSFIRPTDKVALVDAGTWLLNVPELVVEVARRIKAAGPAAFTLAYCSLEERNRAYLGAVGDGLAEAGVSKDVLDGGIYTFPGKFEQHPFTTIVMTPTLKSHTIAGVSGVVKHYATMSKVHVRNYHDNAMETAGKALAEEFGGHRHLVIVDALRFGKVRDGAQFWQKSLILGTDPVATDIIALEVFLRNCATHGNIPPDHHRLLAGTRYKAGISERDRIDVVDLKV